MHMCVCVSIFCGLFSFISTYAYIYIYIHTYACVYIRMYAWTVVSKISLYVYINRQTWLSLLHFKIKCALRMKATPYRNKFVYIYIYIIEFLIYITYIMKTHTHIIIIIIIIWGFIIYYTTSIRRARNVDDSHIAWAKTWKVNIQACMWISAYMYTYIKSIIHKTYTYIYIYIYIHISIYICTYIFECV